MTKRGNSDEPTERSEVGSAMTALNIDTDVHPLYVEKDGPAGGARPATSDDPFHFQSRTVPPGLVNAGQLPAVAPERPIAPQVVDTRGRFSAWLLKRAIRGAFIAALFVASGFVVMIALAAAGRSEVGARLATPGSPQASPGETKSSSQLARAQEKAPAAPVAISVSQAPSVVVPPRVSVKPKQQGPVAQPAPPKPASPVERPAQPGASDPDRRLW